MSERAFNGRILLEHAVKEIAADLHPDPYEIGLAVSAAAEALVVLDRASRRLIALPGLTGPDGVLL
jgi:hypothetical protein